MMIIRSKDPRRLQRAALTMLMLAVFLAVWLCQGALATSLTEDGMNYAAESSSLGDLATSQDESGWTNYILVVDNSGSTVQGLSYTGGVATDKEGLRFSACRLFSDVLPTSHNRMGVILFSGSKTLGSEAECTVLGPVELSDPSSVSAVKASLSDKNVITKRGDLTDIDFALNKAMSVAGSFPNGDTKIVLITDGLNDLTDTDDALTNPTNLEANERTLATIQNIVDSGVKFYVVGLTAGGDSPFRQQFMDFINAMGRAGGGEEEDGALNNVFEAKASDLNQAILEISGAPSPSPEVVPVTIDFDIPDIGVQEAGVTVSFASKDKNRLLGLSLAEPSDNTEEIPLWAKNKKDKPSVDSSRFSVQEDINYINVRILKPTPGTWRLTVTGEKTDIYITTKLDQNTQIRLQGPTGAHVGEPVNFRLYYQTFENGGYRDTDRQTLYDISTANLILTAPDGTERQLPMTASDLHFDGSVAFDQEGEWRVGARAENRYHTRQIPDITFAVAEAPKADPVTDVTLRVAPNNGVGSGGEIEIDHTASEVQIAWSYQGEALSAVCEVMEEGMLRPAFREDSASSMAIPADALKQDVVYNVTLNIQAANGDSVPPAQASFRILPPPVVVPDPVVIEAFSIAPQTDVNDQGVYVYPSGQQQIDLGWTVTGDTTQVECSVTREGMRAPETPQSSGPDYISLNAAALEKGAVYTATLNAGAEDGDSKTASLQFTVNPEPVAPVGFALQCENEAEAEDGVIYTDGNKATLTWTVPGDDLESVQFEVTRGQGDPEVILAKGGDGKINVKLKENEICAVRAVPIPRYGDASDGEAYAQALTVTPKLLSFGEKLKARLPMILGIAGGVLVLVGLIVGIYLIKRPKLRGKMNLIVGKDTFPYTIDLKGRPEGSVLGRFKDIDERYKDQPFLKSLKLIALYMERTDQYGFISMDSNPNPKYSLPNAAALRIDTPDGQVQFAVSKDNTAVFTIIDDFGKDVRCAVTYAEVGQPGYPDLN